MKKVKDIGLTDRVLERRSVADAFIHVFASGRVKNTANSALAKLVKRERQAMLVERRKSMEGWDSVEYHCGNCDKHQIVHVSQMHCVYCGEDVVWSNKVVL